MSLADYKIGTFRIYLDDTTCEWKDVMSEESRNRPLRIDHAKKLCARFRAQGLGRESPANFCEVLVTKAAIQKWLDTKGKSVLVEGEVIPDFYAITGEKFEVQSGQHRKKKNWRKTHSCDGWERQVGGKGG